MGYKPTLGGIKKMQEFLGTKGFPLPIFQVEIYCDRQWSDLRCLPGKGRTISIDEAIQNYGVMREVVDVRLIDDQGDKFVIFSDTMHVGVFTGSDAKEKGWDAILEYYAGDPADCRFIDFMDSADGMALVSIARWGKARVSILDRIKFYCFPKLYADKVFA